MNATVTVTAGIADAQAGVYPKSGSAVDFAGKARMTLNGVELKFVQESDFPDYLPPGYAGQVQAVPGGQPYTFELDYLDGVEMMGFTIAMVQDTQILAPASGATISTSEDLVVRWSNADVAETDQLQIVAVGDPANLETLYLPQATPGFSATTVGVSQLFGNGLIGPHDLVLTRTRIEAPGAPFTGGSISVASEVARITVTFTQ